MNSKEFSSFLYSISSEPLHVLDNAIPLDHYIPIDLSENNPDLKTFNTEASQEWETFINTYCEKHQAKIPYGGYSEKRNLYQRSNYFNDTNENSERNIHLGLDLWLNAESSIYAPLDGKIHSFANNTNFGDYGPTIILEHCIQNTQFYTLYGHLSLNSLANLKVGQLVQANERLATLGNSSVNGDYAPHLHFQIIKNLQGFEGDYPGVCSQDDLEFYLENCPNPDLLLKID